MIRSIIILLILPLFSMAQDSIDPQAKLILDKISSELNATDKVELSFDLTIQFPGAEANVKAGLLQQDGTKFKVEVGPQIILSNGSDVYMINKEMNMAQLSSASSLEESQGMMNPKQMLTMYDSGDYFYAITGEDDFEGKRVLNIEFKPKDRYAEFSKMRMVVNKQTEKPVYLMLFNKDGSQFILNLKSINIEPIFSEKTFNFSKSDFPGITVDDLRID